jgi:DNA-binding winged helix-turn-helix (wHTH) protein
MKLSAIAPHLDASCADSGGSEVQNYLPAVALAVANQELRQRLHLITQAYALLAARIETAEFPTAAVLPGGRVYSFGPFQLYPSRRLLSEENRRVQLGSRAFDILTLLVERAGNVVGKDELVARVWPNVFVEESNLKTQVSALRRALGETRSGRCYIVTIPGRGYNFVAPVRFAERPVVNWPELGQASSHEHANGEDDPYEATPMASLPELVRVISPCA